ncbi:hypothetical protein [Kordia sp.]|uniref:hypothetical protein n=1 Tax=Kordia sp. TaxID=1965332 RepID=UPI003D29B0A9
MKKQKVSLKKLNLSKTKVASFTENNILGGGSFLCLTDNGCGPEMSVWPNICPISHNCPPATHTCQTVNCNSFACQSVVCESIVCASVVC